MFLLHIVLVCMLTSVTVSYRLQCPDKSQRPFRASGYCTTSLRSQYTCLYDTNRLWFFEQCHSNPDYVTPGEKYVITGSLRNVDCSSERYQPFPLWSNVSGECLYTKSLCEGEGQVIYDNGTLISDRKCRCDFTKGYTFVHRPKQKCYCLPSEEDCSCYIGKCARDSILSSGHACVDEEHDKESECPPIEHKSGGSQYLNVKRNTEKQKPEHLSGRLIAFILFFLIPVYAVIILMVHWKQKRKITREKEIILKKILFVDVPDEERNLSTLKKILRNAIRYDDKQIIMVMFKIGSIEEFITVMKILFRKFNKKNCSSPLDKKGNTPLMFACMTGKWRIAELFLRNVNAQNQNMETPLIIACKHGRFELIDKLIQSNADVSMQDKRKRSPLLYSCSALHCTYLYEKIDIEKKNANINFKKSKIDCTNACTVFIRSLINDANVNMTDDRDVTPLMLACQAKCVESIKFLLQHKARVNEIDKIDKSSALLWALQGKPTVHMVAAIKKLIEHGADVNISTKSNNTALIVVCKKMNDIKSIQRLSQIDLKRDYCVEIVKLFLNSGASVNAENNMGENPLNLACKGDHVDIIKLLVDKNVDLRKDNSSVLFTVCRNDSDELFKKITSLSKLDTLTKLDSNGRTFLLYACSLIHVYNDCELKTYVCSEKCTALIGFIVEHYGDVNRADNRGVTPLMVACQCKCVQVVALLLKENASVNAVDNINHSTALVWALRGTPTVSMVKTIDALVGKGADVNILFGINNDTSLSTSPLSFACQNLYDLNSIEKDFLACRRYQIDIIEKLVDTGADLRKGGYTALLTACKYGSIGLFKKITRLYKLNKENEFDSNDSSLLFHACCLLHDLNGREANTLVCSSQCTSLISFIIENYGGVNIADNRGVTPLMIACKRKCLPAVALLLKNKANVNAVDRINSSNALFSAMEGKPTLHMVKAIEMLVDNGADVNIFVQNSNTSLIIACQKVNDFKSIDANIKNMKRDYCTQIFDLFLTKSTDVDIENSMGETPLILACKGDDIDIINKLLKKGADLRKYGYTALLTACRYGSFESFKNITSLPNSSTFIQIDDYGRTLLLHACSSLHAFNTSVCSSKCTALINFIIGKYDTVNVADNSGVTPIMLACQKQCRSVVASLLKNSATINSVDKIDGSSALFWAMQGKPNENLVEVIKMLVNNDADVNISNKNNTTSLIFACQKLQYDDSIEEDPELNDSRRNNYGQIVDLFLTKRADVNVENNMGETPLSLACSADKDDIVEKLVDKVANLKKEGYNALLTACRNESIKSFKKLTSLTIFDKFNRVDSRGRSLLLHACGALHFIKKRENNTSSCSEKCTTLISFIIERYGDVNRADNRGVTPLMIACQRKCVQAVVLLLQKKANIDAMDKIDGSTALTWAKMWKSHDDNTKLIETLVSNNKSDAYKHDRGKKATLWHIN